MQIKVTTKALDEAEQRATAAGRWLENSKHSLPITQAQARDAFGQRIAERDALMAQIDAPIEAALRAVNGRAEAFAITFGSEVRDVARRVEAMLADRGVTKANRVGTVATYVPAGPGANRYKYAAKSTALTLERKTDGWRLTAVVATEVYPKAPERLAVAISEAARDDAVRAALDGFAVRVPASRVA